jgi:hypothetical protein
MVTLPVHGEAGLAVGPARKYVGFAKEVSSMGSGLPVRTRQRREFAERLGENDQQFTKILQNRVVVH